MDFETDFESAVVTFALFETWREGRYEFVARENADDDETETSDTENEPDVLDDTPLSTDTLDSALNERRQNALDRLDKLKLTIKE